MEKKEEAEAEAEAENKFVVLLSFLVRGKISEKHKKDKALQRKILIILVACHLAAFVQSCGYFIQHTAFPYLTKRLHVSAQVYGFIISFTAVLQLIGGPIFGRLGDIYGGRFTLVISFIVLAASYFLQSIATNIPMLFISRIPVMAAHALQSSYMIIADISFEEERADMIGKLGVSHGLGMIAGSGIGGIVTDKLGIRAAFIVAVFVVLVCVFVTLAMIPANTQIIRSNLDQSQSDLAKQKDPEENEHKESLKDSIYQMIEITKTKHMIYLLLVKVISGFPFSVLGSMFTLILMDYYHLGPKENGTVLSYLGLVGMVTQGYLVGVLTRATNDANLILLSIVLMAASSLFLIISESIYLFCVVCVPLTIGGSLIHIVITTLITKIVPKEQTGSALGLSLCTHAVIRSISPTLGGLLLQRVGFFSFGVLGYVINFLLSIYLVFCGRGNFDV